MEGSTNDLRVAVVGNKGQGKSSTINTLLTENVISINRWPWSSKQKRPTITKEIGKINYTFLDAPVWTYQFLRGMKLSDPSPHAILIVIKVERKIVYESKVIQQITSGFPEKAYEKSIIVFTHGDELHEGQTIEDFVEERELLSDLVKKCGGRCHVIDNKRWNDDQKDENKSNALQGNKILNTINKMVTQNNMEKQKMKNMVIQNILGKQKNMVIQNNMEQQNQRAEEKEKVPTLVEAFFLFIFKALAMVVVAILAGVIAVVLLVMVLGLIGGLRLIASVGCVLAGGALGYYYVDDAIKVLDAVKRKVWHDPENETDQSIVSIQNKKNM